MSVSRSVMEQRLARVRAALREQGVDAACIRETSNIRWITGFSGVFDAEKAHALLISPDRCLLHSDSRYGQALEAAAEGTPLELSLEPVSHAALAARFAHETGACALGFEDTITVREHAALQQAVATQPTPAATPHDGGPVSHPAQGEDGSAAASCRLVALDAFIETLRTRKDAHEVATLRAAQAITDAAFDHIVGFMRPGMSEREVQRELDRRMLELGADGLAFDTIVASGPNGALPHAVPSDRKLEPGDAVVMDFGARKDGYCSDMTRTVFVGAPSAEIERAFATLREANETCEKLIEPGVKASDVARAAEEILARHGFGGLMGHGLGHGVGLDIHEAPTLSQRNDAPLEPGNVVTVEPGIYVPGRFGMRLEDFGVVTDAGLEVFTQSTHDMVIIESR